MIVVEDGSGTGSYDRFNLCNPSVIEPWWPHLSYYNYEGIRNDCAFVIARFPRKNGFRLNIIIALQTQPIRTFVALFIV